MTFREIGLTDERDTCECCGRTNLKVAVVLQEIEDGGDAGAFVFFGTTCAARALRRGVKETRKAVKDAQKAAERAARLAFHGHPLKQQVDAEIRAANAAGVPFVERPRQRWHELEKQARSETLARFPTVTKV